MKNILQIWPHFTCKKTLENGKIFSKKVFYFKTNGALHMIALTNKKTNMFMLQGLLNSMHLWV